MVGGIAEGFGDFLGAFLTELRESEVNLSANEYYCIRKRRFVYKSVN